MMEDEKLAARREARRRRILENSHTRLQKITGRIENERTENGPVGSSDDKTFGFYNGVAGDSSSAGDSKLLQLLEKLGGPEDGSGDVGQQQERKPPTLLQRIIATRVHIIVLAALVQWLLASEYSYMFGESALVPLIVWELAQLVLMRPSTLHNTARVDLVTAVLVLCGISAQAAVRTKQWLLRTLIVLQDCTVYFVVLMLCNKAVQWVA